VAVSGRDARRWLDDLVTADLDGLAPGRARRALLLSPTGAVLAECTVTDPGGTILLLQDPAQPRPIDRLLAPYVLSSDVRLEDRSAELAVFAFPGRADPPDAPGGASSAPSALGAGVDLICPEEDRERLRASFAEAFAPAAEADVEAWRVATGIPRFAVDAADGDLPMECGLDGAVASGKGCFLGQEAVARVRNLGHPRRVLLHLAAEGPVRPGEPVLADGEEAGLVTSAGGLQGRWYVLARVRWDARSGPLRTAGGVGLRPAG
jgi:folate-binding protein YgfZ